jgi:hypothetical protein
LAKYGHVIDSRQWDRLREVFTDDAVFVPGSTPEQTTTSLSALVARWTGGNVRHPAAHHSTNVVVDSVGPNRAHSVWKGIAIEADGRAWSVTYEDELVRTENGWRSQRRTVTLRPSTVRQ